MNIFGEYIELFPTDKRGFQLGFIMGCGEANVFLSQIVTKALKEKKPINEEDYHKWEKMIEEWNDYLDKNNLIT